MPYVDFNILHMIDLVTLDRWKLSEKSRSRFCFSQLLDDDLIACDSCWSIQGYIKWFRDVLNIGRQKQKTKKQALYAVLHERFEIVEMATHLRKYVHAKSHGLIK